MPLVNRLCMVNVFSIRHKGTTGGLVAQNRPTNQTQNGSRRILLTLRAQLEIVFT